MSLAAQNSPRQLARLAAQRQLYASAKNILGWQVVLSGPLAVASAVLVLALPVTKEVVAGWGILVTLADSIWLTPWQKRLKERAAGIQEAFDCDVLGLDWDAIKAGARPDPELVKEQADKYGVYAHNMPPLTDWYPNAIFALPDHLVRLTCQRLNCLWDSKQRRRYVLLIICILVAIFGSILTSALYAKLTVKDLVLRVIPIFLPAAFVGIRQCIEQTAAASRLERLKTHALALWDDALSGMPADKVTLRSRSLQDEILESRRRSPLVFDAIFRRLRGKYENHMVYGVEELVADAKRRLG